MLTEDELAKIFTFFQLKGYTWKVDEERVQPSLEQIRDMVNRLIKTADDEAQDSLSVSAGRLLVHKADGYYDVFIHAGEIKYESN
jgi:hypothetical protein